MNTTARARAYLAKLPPAIAGQGGHAATFAAACRLVEFGIGADTAFELLREWNGTHCQPPWTERDLRHKLADAYRRTSPKDHFIARTPHRHNFSFRPSAQAGQTRAVSPRADMTKQDEFPRHNTAGTQSKSLISNPGASFFDGEASNAQFPTLAALRGLSVEGVRLAYGRGLLRFGTYRTRLAWFVLDASQRVIQARRLDGQPWAPGVKAWTLPGSQAAWPVGIGEAQAFPAIALVEGGPDLLAAHHFLWLENHERECAAVAMLGGCARIHPDALPLFAGKRVRIFPHVDDTGDTSANRWAEQLADAGATVDAFSLAGLRRADDAPIKDLCDLAAIHADDFTAHRCLWEIFDYASIP